MLLRTSIANTKKFFQKTIENFKSVLSGGYQRLPKSPPCSSFPCSCGKDLKYNNSYREIGKFNSDFTERLEFHSEKAKRISKKNDTPKTKAVSPAKNYQVERKEDSKKQKVVYKGKRYQDFSISKAVREEKSFLVAKKLKELEMLDKSNVEHVLDIEEVLHYYSRLTCPPYLDIVDSFFTDMYSELLSGQASSRVSNSIWPNRPTLGF